MYHELDEVDTESLVRFSYVEGWTETVRFNLLWWLYTILVSVEKLFNS